ncbi:MAG: TipAS antibiotic-recognition domain-containing protein [Clostridia bacterium]|nr:TipAS antibiotic-recognition domain-containing protein [Clostridia bacterium]
MSREKIYEMHHFDKEVRDRWGSTEAYREHTEKTKNYTKEKWEAAAEGMNAIFVEFAQYRKNGRQPDSPSAKALTAKLRKHITENYYTCTDEILAGLGEMYVCDARFRKNIDRSGEGTAEFVSAAITAYIHGEETK